MTAPRIKTEYDPLHPFIFPWCAWDENTYDGAPDAGPRAHIIGYGATEAEAIAELQAQLEDLE
jgi:hypothetical protein